MTSTRTALAVLAATLLPAAGAEAKASATPCRTVAVATTHGHVARGERLSSVRDGRVLAMDGNTGARVRIPFRPAGLRWLRTSAGARYVAVTQTVTRTGRPGGTYLIAAPLGRDGATPCAGPSGARAFAADVASSTTTDTPLSFGAVEEVAASTRNRIQPLRNDSAQRVCTSLSVHPDGAPRDPVSPNPRPGVYCYKGPGAWLNNSDGWERNADGTNFKPLCELYRGCEDMSKYHHVVLHNNALVLAAKRPAALGDGTALPTTAIAWRPYSANFHNPAGL